MRDYLHTLLTEFGQGWNRFWYTPRDPYTLGAIRWSAALVALWIVASYTPDLQELFGPDGMLPVATVEQLQNLKEMNASGKTPPQFRFSYLDYLDTRESLWIGHAAGLLVLGAFAIGLWSRVTGILSLLVFLSYVHRAPMLTTQAEPVLSFVLLYLCIGPSGACLSLDRLMRRRRAPAGAPDVVPSSWSATVATRLIQVHICVVYLMMVLGKLYSDEWWNGMAIWWMAAKPESRLVDLTGPLVDQIYLINAWTHAIVFYELTFPVMIWNRLARPLWIAAGLILWPLLAVVTGLVEFSLAMLIASLAFVSPETLRACCAGCCGPKRP